MTHTATHMPSAHFHYLKRTVALMRLILITAFIALMAPVSAAYAQELRVVPSGEVVQVTDPERSRAYYGELDGAAQTYILSSSEPFTLFLALVVPDVPGIETDITAEVVDTKNNTVPLTALDGREVTWQGFTDNSGGDAYLAGPTFRATIPEGNYEIRISSPDNRGQYVIIIGEKRGFSLGRIFQAYNALPQIKSQFFGKQSIEAFISPLLLWPTLIIVIILLLLIVLYMLARRRTRSTVRDVPERHSPQNVPDIDS